MPERHSALSNRWVYTGLIAILSLYAVMAALGITWGLPSRDIDRYLFSDEPPWTGETIYRLSQAANKFSADRGADVDPDPLPLSTDRIKTHTGESSAPVLLTSTPEDVAKILLRYRLYTYQPDEMITMMALAGMRPAEWQFDPRLYQYGGLFIYPVGVLIKLCGLLGLIDVRNDVAFYLDHPDEFGKFYLVARAYSAAWGAIGVLVVFAMARRLSGPWTGLFAALLFSTMPVVVCMAHEGKPHLPGAVLMLIAVSQAMNCLYSLRSAGFSPRGPSNRTVIASEQPVSEFRTLNRRYFLLCITCGAAVGMVLSSWPICVLVPMVAWICRSRPVACAPGLHGALPHGYGTVPARAARRANWIIMTALGAFAALTTYFMTNPYVFVNAFVNREVLRSNFGNSLAMYEVSRIGEGFVRVIELTAEGATWPVVILGTLATMIFIFRLAWVRRRCRANERSEPGVQATGAPDHDVTQAASASSPGHYTHAFALVAVGVIFFVQFVLIGAGKPAEYGRFGIFTNTALVITASILISEICKSRRGRVIGVLLGLGVVFMTGVKGRQYMENFRKDSRPNSSRWFAADHLFHSLRIDPPGQRPPVAVPAEPAPYCFPPCHFAKEQLFLVKGITTIDDIRLLPFANILLVRAVDDPMSELSVEGGQRPVRDSASQPAGKVGHYWPGADPLTPISWANKPIMITWRMEMLPPSKKKVTPQTQP